MTFPDLGKKKSGIFANPPNPMRSNFSTAAAAAAAALRAMGTNKDLTPRKKAAIVTKLAHKMDSPAKALPRGALKAVASEFGIVERTATNLAKEARSMLNSGNARLDLSSKRKGKASRPAIITGGTLDRVLAVPVVERTSYRRWAEVAGVAPTTLKSWAKKVEVGRMRRHIKPLLTDRHKLARLEFAYSFLNNVHNGDPAKCHYDDMLKTVHVDEKRFEVCKDGQGCYLLPDEDRPAAPKLQHKSHVTSVMFLCAVARPHVDSKDRRFDGKIGMWPIVEEVPAVRSSKKRAAGTMVTKPVNVNASVYEQLVIDKVLPAIKQKMGDNILVQQDGATPHTAAGVVERIEAVALGKYGMNLIVETQPAQSPDVNLCDLSIFASLQSRQQEVWTKDVQSLVAAVEEVWENYPWQAIERSWITLFGVYDQILLHRGGNDFKIPHNGVRSMQRRDKVPLHMTADAKAVSRATAWLTEAGVLEN